MATEGALKEAPPRLVKTILEQNPQELKETVIKTIDTSKKFYKVDDHLENPYFVEVENVNDSMLIAWNKQGTIPLIFYKVELILENGNKWFMFTVEDVKNIQKKLGNIDGVLASPKEAKNATLDWTTLNDTILYKLRNIMYDLHGSMSLIIPSKDTFYDLKKFKEKITSMTGKMNYYPDNIKAFLESVLIWVVAALVVAARDNKAYATNLYNEKERFYRNRQSELRRIRGYVASGFKILNDEDKKIYDEFLDPNIRSLSDEEVDDILYSLQGRMNKASTEETNFKDEWSRANSPSVSDALKNVFDKIVAISANSEFNPISLKMDIDDLILILRPKNPSTGGRRRTNKKRSTRRKKKRGKRRRSYRTKR
jgi:hypothetical protein